MWCQWRPCVSMRASVKRLVRVPRPCCSCCGFKRVRLIQLVAASGRGGTTQIVRLFQLGTSSSGLLRTLSPPGWGWMVPVQRRRPQKEGAETMGAEAGLRATTSQLAGRVARSGATVKSMLGGIAAVLLVDRRGAARDRGSGLWTHATSRAGQMQEPAPLE